MKKTALIFIFLLIYTTASLSAWDPSYLTKFPSCTDADDWILNLGIGLDTNFGSSGNYTYLPSLRLSFDRNAALGDLKLPFFFGGHVGYSGYGFKYSNPYVSYSWFNHRIPLGFRAGYHFNWGVDNLDTYAVTTAGYILNFYTGDTYNRPGAFGNAFFGVNIGARWFISKGFGFWAEAGFSSLSVLEIGVSFKF